MQADLQAAGFEGRHLLLRGLCLADPHDLQAVLCAVLSLLCVLCCRMLPLFTSIPLRARTRARTHARSHACAPPPCKVPHLNGKDLIHQRERGYCSGEAFQGERRVAHQQHRGLSGATGGGWCILLQGVAAGLRQAQSSSARMACGRCARRTPCTDLRRLLKGMVAEGKACVLGIARKSALSVNTDPLQQGPCAPPQQSAHTHKPTVQLAAARPLDGARLAWGPGANRSQSTKLCITSAARPNSCRGMEKCGAGKQIKWIACVSRLSTLVGM